MTDKLVAGVDFSAAKTVPNDTWITTARVGANTIEVMEVRHVGSHALAQELATKSFAAAGIDCPFSLPNAFINYLAMKKPRPPFESWQELAQELVFMPFEDFDTHVKNYKKEPKRFCDTFVPGPAASPLHRVNPSMVKMTFAGMKLLAMLDPTKFFVVPFQDQIAHGCAVMEVYPRAVLKTLELPDTNYKSAEKAEQDRVRAARRVILDGLMAAVEKKKLSFGKLPPLVVPPRLHQHFIDSDHALDSLLACYCTAIYVFDPSLFPDPFDSNNADILLEGWIYHFQPKG